MKKLLSLLILTLITINPSKAEIFEFVNCIPGSNHKLKDLYNNQHSNEIWDRVNTLYFKFEDEPYKVENSYGTDSAWVVVDTVSEIHLGPRDIEGDIKYLLDDGYKKIKQYEKYIFSINTNDNSVSRLRIYTDEYMRYRNDYYNAMKKFKKNPKWNKNDDSVFKRVSSRKQTEIDRYTISEYVGGYMYAFDSDHAKYHPNERFGIKIDLEKLLITQNFMNNIDDDFQNFSLLCTEEISTSTNESGSSGTAFFVSNKGHLLTNNHVVEGCTLSKIIYLNKEYDTELIATDKTLDLALLKAKLKPKSIFNFSKDGAKKLNKIFVAGYPLGKGLSDDLKISSGIVSSLKGFMDNSNEIQIDAPINPGNSGGPIINENGDLVAIAVSGLAKDQTEGINFGIKSSAAELFLKSNKVSPNKSLYSRTKNNDVLLEILEEGTVYTYCD